MAYPKLWDTNRLRAVLTTESRQKSRDLFLQTHRPFRRIRLDFCKEDGLAATFINEEELRAIVQSGPLQAHNRLFLIVGEAGSGKSELCQWLEYTVDRERSLPIHIPRSMTSAAHVVALLRESLGDTTRWSALQRAPLHTQAEYIALSAVVLLYEQGSAELTPVDRWVEIINSEPLKRAIAEHLVAAIEQRWSDVLLGDDSQLLELCTACDLTIEPERVASVAQALRRLLGRALEQTLWLGNVRALLGALSEQAISQGRRPLLLLEDVTAFQLLGDRLLDHLLDLTSGHFDAVIGVTTGYEHTRLANAAFMGDLTHVHHRLHARCVLTDDQGRSYGFEDDLIEFTRGYLHAIRDPQTEHTPPFGGDLYPFTETALRRALAALHEEGNPRHTPRLFLEHVLSPALLADDAPSIALDRSMYLLRPPILFRHDSIEDEQLQSLLRWYGDVGDQYVTLESAIPKSLGLHVPNHLLHDGYVRVERAYVPQLTEQHVASSDWQLELRELQTWLSDGGVYPSRETLKRGIERVLLSLGDPRLLGSPHSLSLNKAEIAYARGDERLPIVLGKGSGDQPSTEAYIKIQVQGSPDERGILEELAYLHLSGATLTQVCQNVALTLEWAQQHWDAYHTEVHALLSSRLGMPPEELIWTAWRLVSALDGHLWHQQPFTKGRGETTVSYEQVTFWSERYHPACYSAGETLLTWHETIRRLFIGAFMLRDSLLDRERVLSMIAADQGDESVRRVARIPLKTLQTLPFKIRPSGQNLYSLLAPLQRYAFALAQLDIPTALQRDLDLLIRSEAQLANQASLDITLLQEQLNELRVRCGEVGVTWLTSWDQPLALAETLTTHELTDLLTEVQSLRTQVEAQASCSCDLWEYQTLRHALQPVLKHPYWAVLSTVQTIQQALLQKARGRYRRDGRLLTGTRSYHQLVQTTRAIWQELGDASKTTE